MNSYQICKKTVMDSSDPSITFDSHSISNHFYTFKNKKETKWLESLQNDNQLQKNIEKIKRCGKDREFDCILGMSGGADSSYMLHTMVRKYGLRPLVFHVDGGWNSEIAVHNIKCLVEKLKLDLFTEVIDWNEMRNFQLSMFKSGVPHLDIPQDMAFIGVLYKFAAKHKIRYILNGGNLSTECVSTPLQYLYWPTDLIQIRDILKKFGTIPMKSYPFSSVLYHKVYLPALRRVKIFKPLNFMPYIKKQASEILQREYDWKAYPQKHYESRFTRFFEGWWLPTRFGFDMRRREFSSLILTGQMNREEAIQLLKKPALGPEVAVQEFEYVAAKLGISPDELRQYHVMPKKFYWNYANQKWLFDIGEKIFEFLTGGVRGGAY